MSYHGVFKNPTEGFYVNVCPDGKYRVWIREDRASDGSAPPDRLHNGKWNKEGFEEASDAEETIEAMRESFEEDYDDYLEENRYEIAQMERYEAFRNEY
jgi:hypothetical protein